MAQKLHKPGHYQFYIDPIEPHFQVVLLRDDKDFPAIELTVTITSEMIGEKFEKIEAEEVVALLLLYGKPQEGSVKQLQKLGFNDDPENPKFDGEFYKNGQTDIVLKCEHYVNKKGEDSESFKFVNKPQVADKKVFDELRSIFKAY